MVAIGMLGFALVALVQTEEAGMNWNLVWQFAIVGAATSLLRYVGKIKGDKKLKFNWLYLLVYGAVGAGAGVYAAWRDLEIATVYGAVEASGLVLVIFAVVKGGKGITALVPVVIKLLNELNKPKEEKPSG